MKLLPIFICLSMISEVAICQTDLKPDELFSTMRASRGRYVSIEATIEIKGFYERMERQVNPILMYSQETLYRRSGNIVYTECVTKTFSETGDLDQHFKEVALLTPKSIKYFLEEPIGNKHPYGSIDKNTGNELWGRMSLTPDVMFWWNLAKPGLETKYSRFLREHADKATIAYDKMSQAYILHNRVGVEENAPGYRYTVDPSKGFMPTVQEWLDWDKTPIEKYVCADYRQINGLWAPFRYSIYLPNGNLGTDVTITSLSINKSIDPEKLTYEFPVETQVIDRILDVKYVVKEDTAGQSAERDVNIAAANLAPPATDAELAQRTLEAQQLLVQERQTTATTPSVVPVEVSPIYVWVLDGRHDYTLSVKSASGTIPTLGGQSFEGNGLILHSLDDQLSSTGQIKVTLERPENLACYADGVLTLIFSDQTAQVHFIAAPR